MFKFVLFQLERALLSMNQFPSAYSPVKKILKKKR